MYLVSLANISEPQNIAFNLFQTCLVVRFVQTLLASLEPYALRLNLVQFARTLFASLKPCSAQTLIASLKPCSLRSMFTSLEPCLLAQTLFTSLENCSLRSKIVHFARKLFTSLEPYSLRSKSRMKIKIRNNYLYFVSHLFSYSSLSSTEYTTLYSILQPWGKNEGLAVGLTCVCCPKVPLGCLPLLLPAPPY